MLVCTPKARMICIYRARMPLRTSAKNGPRVEGRPSLYSAWGSRAGSANGRVRASQGWLPPWGAAEAPLEGKGRLLQRTRPPEGGFKVVPGQWLPGKGPRVPPGNRATTMWASLSDSGGGHWADWVNCCLHGDYYLGSRPPPSPRLLKENLQRVHEQ